MDDQGAMDVLRLERAWTYKVSVLARLVAKRTSAVLARTCDLNLSQWRTLAAVADRPGRTARDVVAVTPMDKGLVSRAVAALEAGGFLERRGSETDARLAHLHLTTAGAALYARILAALREDGVAGPNGLSPGEEAALFRTLERLARELDA